MNGLGNYVGKSVGNGGCCWDHVLRSCDHDITIRNNIKNDKNLIYKIVN